MIRKSNGIDLKDWDNGLLSDETEEEIESPGEGYEEEEEDLETELEDQEM